MPMGSVSALLLKRQTEGGDMRRRHREAAARRLALVLSALII